MGVPKTLTYEQAKQLKWFCANVTGVRLEYYKVMDIANSFDDRLKRLEKTCELIENFFKDQNGGDDAE